jgi:hypothetical protein
MSEPHSTPNAAPSKPARESITPSVTPGKPPPPAKPYPEYPLRAHALGYWCKKIRGRLHYFGKWDDPDGALQKYLEQKDDLHAGRTPRRAQEALIIWDAVNAFLNAKKEQGRVRRADRTDLEGIQGRVRHAGKVFRQAPPRWRSRPGRFRQAPKEAGHEVRPCAPGQHDSGCPQHLQIRL